MNPILHSALGSILRWALAIVAGHLVKAGVWDATEAEKYVTAAALAGLALGWSIWQKFKSRQSVLTALTLPKGATENDLKEVIAGAATLPSVKTDPDKAPKTTTENP